MIFSLFFHFWKFNTLVNTSHMDRIGSQRIPWMQEDAIFFIIPKCTCEHIKFVIVSVGLDLFLCSIPFHCVCIMFSHLLLGVEINVELDYI